ncbi:histidine kinase dimerization/phosphoacceptor domain -containing protein [Winogradskyella sp. 3972H.M.0a.05]|uniref:tetratricopeptide repeat-containing sensor histidine kinase n=1 Tax=Winogradskyella sp. 3972H.M.0a.05 TaxID=2950277 RepID=UPI00339AD920
MRQPLSFLVCLILLLGADGYCQNIDKNYIDSLFSSKENIKNIVEDKDINKLSKMLFRKSVGESIKIYNRLDSLYKDNDYIRINLLDDYASLAHRAGTPMKAKSLQFEGLKLAEQYKVPIFLFKYNQLLSYHYIDRAMPDSALYYVQRAEKTIEDNLQLSKLLHVIYERKAQIEGLLGHFEKRDDYLEKAVASTDTIKNHPNRGFILAKVAYHYKVTKNYKKHADYASRLRKYYFKKNDFKFPEQHTSLSSILSFEETDEHIVELKKILDAPDVTEDSSTHHVIITSLAEALLQKGRYQEIVPLLKKYADENYAFVNTYDRILNLVNLEDAYEYLGDYENAFKVLEYRKLLQDSVRRVETVEKFADFEVKYETERKETQLKVVSIENEKNKQQKRLFSIIAIGGLIACAAIGLLLFKNSKKKTQLEKQKQLLETTLDEKNVLLKEIHHRVKNSFQIVSSLLYLQSENVEDKEAQIAIKEAENRVRSMVLIHQKLYSKDDLVGINTKEYIEDLTKDIIESHQFKKEPISYNLDIEPKVLDIETITPLGLILNELITNVIKHAFTDITETSKMAIEFKQEDDELVLKVSDNGIGMPNEVKESSFGLKLIKALSKKLKAQLDFIPNNDGTTALLRMKRFQAMA